MASLDDGDLVTFIESLDMEFEESNDTDDETLPDTDDSEDMDESARSIVIEFPYEAANIHDITYISIPIRDVLTMAAEKLPEEREYLIRLRDDFYSGDRIEDFDIKLTSNRYRGATSEMVAEMRLERLEREPERAAARAEVQLEIAEDLAIEKKSHEADALFDAANAALKAEIDENWKRICALDSAWDQFVRDKRNRATDPTFCESDVRHQLYAEQEQLLLRRGELMDERYRRRMAGQTNLLTEGGCG